MTTTFTPQGLLYDRQIKREQKYEVRIAVDAGISVMLRRDACLECAKKIETILVGLPLGSEPSR